ncbi:hypothetical protein GEMRC1_006485 [Eukaryota sp. GEM-RC1]
MDFTSEADEITFSTLRSVGAPIEDLTSLKDVTSSVLVSIVSHCLQLINPDLTDLPQTLPSDLPMTTKFKSCTALANIIKEAGYIGDLGYQTFLYPVEEPVRNLLRWIVENLPKVSSTVSSSSENLLLSRITAAVADWSLAPSSPVDHLPSVSYLSPSSSFISESSTTHLSPVLALSIANVLSLKELEDETIDQAPSLEFINNLKKTIEATKQRLKSNQKDKTSSKKLLDDLISSLQSQSSSSTFTSDQKGRFALVSDFGTDTQESNAKIRPLDNEETLEEEIDKLTEEISTLESSLTSLQEAFDQTQEQLTSEQEVKGSLEKSFTRAKVIVEMLEDVDGNAERLQSDVVEKSVQLEKMKSAGEETVKGLEEKRQELDESNSQYLNNFENLSTVYKSLRKTGKDLAVEVQQLKQEEESLTRALDKGTSAKPRSYYIYRMREAQKTVKKQRTEILKILDDVRELEKELSTSTTGLQVEYRDIHDTLLKLSETKKDPIFKELLNSLKEVHKSFANAARLIKKLGDVTSELRESETVLSSDQQKLKGLNVEQLGGDLKAVKEENSKLKKKLK